MPRERPAACGCTGGPLPCAKACEEYGKDVCPEDSAPLIVTLPVAKTSVAIPIYIFLPGISLHFSNQHLPPSDAILSAPASGSEGIARFARGSRRSCQMPAISPSTSRSRPSRNVMKAGEDARACRLTLTKHRLWGFSMPRTSNVCRFIKMRVCCCALLLLLLLLLLSFLLSAPGD